MPHNIKVSIAAANAKTDAFATLMSGGFIRIYDGIQPASANASLGAATLLGELGMDNPAFESAVDGLLIAYPVTPESDADASGTARFYRLFAADGTTPMGDGACGITGSGSDLEMDNTSIVLHGEITCTGFAHQESLG